MRQYTQGELQAALNSRIPWLRRLGCTSAAVTKENLKDPDSAWVLVLRFDPVTPAIREAVAEELKDFPVRVAQMPMAKGYEAGAD
jgi:hypothetical protein